MNQRMTLVCRLVKSLFFIEGSHCKSLKSYIVKGIFLLLSFCSFISFGDENLCGEWHFNEISGTIAYDSSTNSNDGTLQYLNPSTCWVDGKFGKALKFENGGWVRCDSDPSLALETLTIEYWLKPGSLIGSSWEGTHVRKSGTGVSRPYWIYGARPTEPLTFEMRGDDGVYHGLTSTKTDWDVNLYYHIAVQYDNSTGEWKIYVNGNLDNSQTDQFTPSTTEGYLYVGLWKFDGIIDELKIHSRILSKEEIENIVAAVYLEFNEDSGTIAFNSSTNGNDGILINLNSPTCWVDGKFGKALKFEDGGYVRCDSNQSLELETLTIEYWFKPGNWTGGSWEGTHIKKNGTGSSRPYWIYGARPAEPLTFEMRGDDGVYHALQSNKTDWDVNTFYHVALQYDNSTGEWKIYVNGNLDNSQTDQFSPSTTEGDLYIGLGKFDGVIDQLKINPYIVDINKLDANIDPLLFVGSSTPDRVEIYPSTTLNLPVNRTQPMLILVRNEEGCGVPGINVNLSVTGSGGELSEFSDYNGSNKTTSLSLTTDSNGKAQARFHPIQLINAQTTVTATISSPSLSKNLIVTNSEEFNKVTLGNDGFFTNTDGETLMLLGGLFLPCWGIIENGEIVEEYGWSTIPIYDTSDTNQHQWFEYLEDNGINCLRGTWACDPLYTENGEINESAVAKLEHTLDIGGVYGIGATLTVGDITRPLTSSHNTSLGNKSKRQIMFEANNFLREFISRLIYNPNVWVYELTNEQDVDSIDWSERFVQVIKEIDEVTPVMIDSGGFSDPLTWMNDTSIDIFQLHLYPSGGALFGKTGVDNGIHWDVHYNLMTGPKPWFLGESGGYNTHTPMGAPPSSAAGEYLSWDSIWFSLLNRTNASFIWGVEQFSITPFRMAAEICPLVDWKKLSEAKAKVAVAVPRDISNPYYFLTEEGRNALNVMADYTIWGLENGVTIDFPVDASGYDIQCSINSFTPPTITPPFDISTGYQFKYRMSESGDLVVGYLRNIDHIELWQPTTGINGSYIRIRVSTLAELDWNLPFSEYRLTVWDLDTEQKLENASLTDGIKGNWSLNNTDHDFVLMWNKIAIGNWLFDEGSGSAASDSSGNDNDGILQYLDPSTCWVDGKYGKAIKFENGGWVRCDSDPSLALETLTIEYWFKPSNWTGDAWQGTHLFKSGTGNSRPYWIYGARPGEKLTFVRIGDDGVYHALQSNKTNWDVNTFYHIVAQYDNSNGEWKIYVNGTLDNSQTLQITPSTTEGYLYIGLWTFDGVIDELKIYNTILSASEIYQHYQGQ